LIDPADALRHLVERSIFRRADALVRPLQEVTFRGRVSLPARGLRHSLSIIDASQAAA
jgi:hypothetical protein